MDGPARKWKERQKLLASRTPQVRVDRVTVTTGDKSYHSVVIEGFGLLPALTPPHVTVGGVTLEQAKFERGGRRVTGVLRAEPQNRHVVVDLGYARAESSTGPSGPRVRPR